MSPTAPDAPPIVVPSAPLQLQYEVNMSPATTTSGRIDITVTSPDVPRVACDVIYIDVPVGPLEGDVFIRAPRIASNSKNWAVSGPGSSDTALPDKVTGYYRFTVKNQTPGGQGLVPLHPFALVITGTVSTEHLHTNQAQLVISEKAILADNKPFPPDTPCQRKTFPVAKYESFLLYVNSFYATSPGSADVPKAGFAAGEAIHLSWESNGHLFELYQNGKLVYEGERSSYEVCTIQRNGANQALDKAGEVITKKDDKGQAIPLTYDEEVFSTELVVLSQGLSAATTFVLKATGAAKSTLYATLTLTVSNPCFSPPLDLSLSPEVLAQLKMPSGPDTAHCLRVSDGTPHGNIVLQTLTGDNSGITAISFNGYYNQIYNKAYPFDPTKAFYSLGTCQGGGVNRPPEDFFFIKMVSPERPGNLVALSVNAKGHVGIGTRYPKYPLHVYRPDKDGKSLAIFVEEGINQDYFYGLGYSTDQLTVFAGAAPDGDPHLVVQKNGNVGIGTTEPVSRFSFGSSAVNSNVAAGRLAIYENPNGQYFYGLGLVQNPAGDYGMGLWGGSGAAQPYNGSTGALPHLYLDQNTGNVGIGTTEPKATLQVARGTGEYGTAYFGGTQYGSHFNYSTNEDTYIRGGKDNSNVYLCDLGGNVGIGTGAPKYPLHITKTRGGDIGSFGWLGSNGDTSDDGGVREISICATGWIMGGGIGSFSDLRLKIVAGPSDAAADLALLRRIRITDYTMRDRVQFGDQAFKKLIGQELEEAFPQAVHRHTGFLPDIYARANQVQRQGEALLLTLPAGLPEAATAGQRLKLIGPAGEVVATLAEAAAAGSPQLLVSGANELADTPGEVFVFGLERPDVRTVDYDAVAMLNVSATQALARQVDELHQQNAALHAQCQTQATQANELRAALHLLQQQVAGLLGQPAGVAQPS